MDKNISTVKEYLENKKETISKNKFEKIQKTLEGIDEKTEIKWGYFAGKSEKAEEESGKPTTLDMISTIDVDRDNEVLIPDGCDLSGYSKTPTVLFGHDYRSIPIGVSKWQKIEQGKGIMSKTEYFQSEFAKDVYEASVNGALANSVGVIPIQWVEKNNKNDETKYKELIEKYNIQGEPQRIYTQWQLLEYSKVPVASNPQALTLALQKAKTKEMKDCISKELEEILEKRVCGKKDLPIADDGRAWDGTEAEKRVRAWATGANDEIDWKKYQQAFVYVDIEKAVTLGGYKLPFADIIDGKLTAVWRAVASAMAALLGARGGVDIPENERKSVYNFLASYYKRWDKEPPEFREYSQEELEKMFQEEKKKEVKIEQKRGYKLPFADIIAGAVLNKRNKEALKQAQQLIQEVLDSAENNDNTQQEQASEEAEKKVEENIKKTDTNEIEGLDLDSMNEPENSKTDDVSDEDANKILEAISKVVDKKINSLLGKV